MVNQILNNNLNPILKPILPCSSLIVEGEPPSNTQQATIQQPPQSGVESEVDEGSWSGDQPINYTYQWQLDGIDLVGQTLKTILVIAAYIGKALRCVVTATNQFGFSFSITAALIVSI